MGKEASGPAAEEMQTEIRAWEGREAGKEKCGRVGRKRKDVALSWTVMIVSSFHEVWAGEKRGGKAGECEGCLWRKQDSGGVV